jgi:copper resistance protein C
MTSRLRFASYMVSMSLLFLRPPPTDAHAFLDHADPRVGSTVPSPSALTLQFTESIEPAFCRVEVVGPAGNIEIGPIEHPGPAMLRVALPPLPPGDYTVQWAVVSVDTHPTGGRFTFSVKHP